MPRRAVITRDDGHATGMTASDPDTGSGGREPGAPNSRLPPHARHAEPNARGEPRPRAGARDERRLLGVGSTAMLGSYRASLGKTNKTMALALTRC